MAGGHPKFGGTNNVPSLDFGQEGGALFNANQAHATTITNTQSPKLVSTKITLPESNTNFVQFYSFDGKAITVDFAVRTVNDAVMDAIEADIESYIEGKLRANNGGLTTTLDRIHETKLTDWKGRVLSERAVIKYYNHLEKRRNMTAGIFTRYQKARLVFEIME